MIILIIFIYLVQCMEIVDLTDKEYFHMPGSEYDSWFINDKGYIYARELLNNCEVCFKTSKESYFAFSAWDPENPTQRRDLPILLDNKLYKDGATLFKSKSFCVIAKSNLYFKLQHSKHYI